MDPKKSGLIEYRVLFVACALITFAACSDENPAQPNTGVRPTFDNIWPVAVGQFWDFELHNQLYSIGNPIYQNPADVPPIPDLATLYADVTQTPPGAPVEVKTGSMRWEVTADATVDPDTTIMNVTTRYLGQDGGPRAPHAMTMGPSWHQSENRIASYGYGFLQWLHLEGALTPGHKFTAQLAEGLASDIVLTTRIWNIRPYSVAGTNYPNCVESFFLLDLGIQQGVDENGYTIGYIQAYEYGLMVYAPEVGPVFCRSKFISGPDFNMPGTTLHVREAVLSGRGVVQ